MSQSSLAVAVSPSLARYLASSLYRSLCVSASLLSLFLSLSLSLSFSVAVSSMVGAEVGALAFTFGIWGPRLMRRLAEELNPETLNAIGFALAMWCLASVAVGFRLFVVIQFLDETRTAKDKAATTRL